MKFLDFDNQEDIPQIKDNKEFYKKFSHGALLVAGIATLTATFANYLKNLNKKGN